MEELSLVVLTHDISEHGLKAGDIGTIVHCYADNAAWEVEFVTADGRTIGVFTLSEADLRPMSREEILHARPLSAV